VDIAHRLGNATQQPETSRGSARESFVWAVTSEDGGHLISFATPQLGAPARKSVCFLAGASDGGGISPQMLVRARHD